MHVMHFVGTIFLSVPFLVLFLARFIEYHSLHSRLDQYLQQNGSESARKVLEVIRLFFDSNHCKVGGAAASINLNLTYDQSYIDIQRKVYELAESSLANLKRLRHFHSSEKLSFPNPSSFLDVVKSSAQNNDVWTSLSSDESSVVQYTPIQLVNYSSDRYGCEAMYRSLLFEESNLDPDKFFDLLAGWNGVNLFFLTKSWQVRSQIYISFLRLMECFSKIFHRNRSERPIFSFEWYNGTIDILYVPIYSLPLRSRDLFVMRFVDKISKTLVFQSFYPVQLVSDESDELLRSMISSYLKSHNLHHKNFENRWDDKNNFQHLFIGLSLSPLIIESQSSNSYLIEVVRHNGNSGFLWNPATKRIDSYVFFAYFRYQLKRLLLSFT